MPVGASAPNSSLSLKATQQLGKSEVAPSVGPALTPEGASEEFSDCDIGASGVNDSCRRVTLGSWNVRGLTSHKQSELLSVAERLKLDVLAVCETHHGNQEHHVQWQLAVTSSPFVWLGRPAVYPAGRLHRGHASGGVGLLIRRDWERWCQTMPQCEHSNLCFVRLQLPDMPEPLFLASVYVVPVGSPLEAENELLMRELLDRVGQYEQQGAVVLAGDFNTHVGDTPSTFLQLDAPQASSELAECDFAEPTTLARACAHHRATTASGRRMVRELDSAALVVLNGLEAVGPPAEPTHDRGGTIDLFVVSARHWQEMDPVCVEKKFARTALDTDHELIMSAFSYSVHRTAAAAAASDAAPANTAAATPASVVLTRFRTNARGDRTFFDDFQHQCAIVLPSLTAEWREAAERGEPLEVEAAWAAFHQTVHTVARDTLREQSPQLKRTMKPVPLIGHASLRGWRQRRRELWVALRRVPVDETACSRARTLRRQISVLDGHIRNEVRRQLHDKQLEQLERVTALKESDRRGHWQALKRVGNIRLASAAIPASALDSAGNEQTLPAAVRDVWFEAWGQLAQHRPDDPAYDVNTYASTVLEVAAAHAHKQSEEHIEEEMEQTRSPQPTARQLAAASALNTDVTEAEVAASVRRLKRGKAVGSDGLCAEVLKEGGPAMLQCLHELIRLVWLGGEVPMDWLRGIVVPLHKDGDKRQPLNYRPITLLSIVGKVYTSVLCARLTDWAESQGIIVQEQGGFRPKRGCPEQVFALTELIKLRRMAELNTYACFIDIKKAYDTVWHDGLKAKLLKYGIHGRMFVAICSLYEACESSVNLGATLGYTAFFPVETGVRQGCVLSPILYSLFINDLALQLKQLEAEGIGVPLGTGRLCILLYADDIVLLGESPEQLRRLMASLSDYTTQWRFAVNHAKCGLMRFGPTGTAPLPDVRLTIGRDAVPWVTCYKYLGVELHSDRSKPFSQFKRRILASATRAGHMVGGMGMYSGKLSVPLGDQVYCAMVRPLLEYCSEVWSTVRFPAAERVQSAMGKRILACPLRTSSEAVRGELGWMSMEARYQQARVCFWGKLTQMQHATPARLVYELSQEHSARHRESAISQCADSEPSEGLAVLYAQPRGGTHGLIEWAAQVEVDLRQLGLTAYWRNPALVSAKWSTVVRHAVQVREQNRWWHVVSQCRPALLELYVPLRLAGLDADVVPALQHRSAYLGAPHGGWNDQRLFGRRVITMLRCGSAPLLSLTGGWGPTPVPVEERYCELCAEAVETATHFLLDCPHHHSARERLYVSIDELVRQYPSEAVSTLSELAPLPRLLILAGHAASALTSNQQVQRQIVSRCMVAVGQWWRERCDALAAARALA